MNTFIFFIAENLSQQMFWLFTVCRDLCGHDATVTVAVNVCFYPATMWVLPEIAYFGQIPAQMDAI